MARIIEYIISDDLRGDGTPENIYRRVVQLWSKEGVLIAEYDPSPAGDNDRSVSFFNPNGILPV